MQTDIENNNVKMGLRDGVPIALVYLTTSFAFGIFATSSGLSTVEAIMMSVFNLTSAGQFAAVPIMVAGGTYIELALTQLIINMRYSLMSVSLSQRFSGSIMIRHRFLIAYANTDEVFAAAISKKTPVGKKYMLSLILLPFLGWSLGTTLGAIAGNVLPKLLVNSFGIAIYAMFIAILMPEARVHLPTALCILAAAAISAVFYYVPYLSSLQSGVTIMIIAVSVGVVFALVAPIKAEEAEDCE